MSGGLNTAVCEDPGCGDCIDRGALVVSPLVSGDEFDADAFAVAAAVSGDGRTAAVGLGDGTILLVDLSGGHAAFTQPFASPGMPLCIVADRDGAGFLVGCDDGSLTALSPDGVLNTVSSYDGKWVEHLAVHPESGLRAAAVGRTVHVLDGAGGLVAAFKAPEGTVAGIAFSPDGTKIAAAHYNGVTAWDLTGDQTAPLSFAWNGAHTAIAWSPDGRYIVTATQDNELHTWDLETGSDMRMSGYPAKVRTLSFTADSAFLAAAGADTVTSWPFADGGPKGRTPLELGYVFNGVVTHVACHPTAQRVAAGNSDGTVLIGDIVKGDALTAKASGGGGVTSLTWSPDGESLVAGTEDGMVSVLRVAAD